MCKQQYVGVWIGRWGYFLCPDIMGGGYMVRGRWKIQVRAIRVPSLARSMLPFAIYWRSLSLLLCLHQHSFQTTRRQWLWQMTLCRSYRLTKERRNSAAHGTRSRGTNRVDPDPAFKRVKTDSPGHCNAPSLVRPLIFIPREERTRKHAHFRRLAMSLQLHTPPTEIRTFPTHLLVLLPPADQLVRPSLKRRSLRDPFQSFETSSLLRPGVPSRCRVVGVLVTRVALFEEQSRFRSVRPSTKMPIRQCMMCKIEQYRNLIISVPYFCLRIKCNSDETFSVTSLEVAWTQQTKCKERLRRFLEIGSSGKDSPDSLVPASRNYYLHADSIARFEKKGPREVIRTGDKPSDFSNFRPGLPFVGQQTPHGFNSRAGLDCSLLCFQDKPYSRCSFREERR